MATYLITRHAGAVKWMALKGHHYDVHLTHLADDEALAAGDTVVGSLPVNVVADLNERGVRYVHLSLHVPESLRGKELSVAQLLQLNASLEPFCVERLANADEQ